jgi:hypothetical protein
MWKTTLHCLVVTKRSSVLMPIIRCLWLNPKWEHVEVFGYEWVSLSKFESRGFLNWVNWAEWIELAESLFSEDAPFTPSYRLNGLELTLPGMYTL